MSEMVDTDSDIQYISGTKRNTDLTTPDNSARLTPLQTQQAFLGILIILTSLWALVGSVLVIAGVMPIGLGWTLGPIGYIVTFILAYVFIRLAIEHALEASMEKASETFAVMTHEFSGDPEDIARQFANTIDLSSVQVKGRG